MSIVRDNLMTRPGYTPYCGSVDCGIMPRTRWDGAQFRCSHCGWRSEFPDAFISEYRAKWGIKDAKPSAAAKGAQTLAMMSAMTMALAPFGLVDPMARAPRLPAVPAPKVLGRRDTDRIAAAEAKRVRKAAKLIREAV